MSSHGKIRFSCRVVRLRDAMTGSRASHHVTHCADCQAYYRATDTLVHQLRATAPHRSQPTPDDLAQRIAQAVRQSTPQPRRSRALSTFTALAGAAAVFAFSFYIVRQHPTKRPVEPSPEALASASKIDVTQLEANIDSFRNRLLASVQPSAEKLATDNPLTQELASVRTDARTALGFLALNFLPSDSARQIEARIDPTRS